MDITFRTDDISISAFLLARGARIIDVISDRPRHFIFVFDDEDKCQELKRNYLNNGEAPARELFARREELISEIREKDGYRNGGNYGRSQ